MVRYKDLLIESQVPREGGREFGDFTYSDSLTRLRTAGYQRHLRPAEAFGVIIAGLEGKLTPELQVSPDNTLPSFGEWLSLALEWKRGKGNENILTCYLDPEGLELGPGTEYVKTSKWNCSEKKEFVVDGILSTGIVNLQKVDHSLVEFLYGRSLADLPWEMSVGNISPSLLYLPNEGELAPVRLGAFNKFGIDGSYDTDALSRGCTPLST